MTLSLLTTYQKTRALTQELAAPLAPEDQVVQPVPYVSPPKWHLAHTTWFFETFLLQAKAPNYQLFHPQYPYLFNSYYEQAGERWQRSQRGFLSRPTVAEILEYRTYVDQHLEKLILELEHYDPQEKEAIQATITLGIHHEQQHQELLLYDLKYILGHNPLFPAYHSPQEGTKNGQSPTETSPQNYLEVSSGLYEIGHQGNSFYFDNERGRHSIFLHPYRILDRLITCGEYLGFIEAGGYQDPQHWLMEGWEWIQAEKIIAPLYWHLESDKNWKIYTLQGRENLDKAVPVMHLSFYEADAFARWSGKRLPTEFEWEIACNLYEPAIPKVANLLDLKHLRPQPRIGQQTQFYGDVWEWTSSAYLPYPYYEIPPGALGEYNGKFMVNQMVLRGGSFGTLREHIRSTYRNFFHPQMRWQFAGLRLAEYI
ncbi:MAG: ergothioneine biosynthesis protein EgtB [Synechococcus sp.]|nr:ergothioneine biosynthesis protein EgtB [Synechococcus sp.]